MPCEQNAMMQMKEPRATFVLHAEERHSLSHATLAPFGKFGGVREPINAQQAARQADAESKTPTANLSNWPGRYFQSTQIRNMTQGSGKREEGRVNVRSALQPHGRRNRPDPVPGPRNQVHCTRRCAARMQGVGQAVSGPRAARGRRPATSQEGNRQAGAPGRPLSQARRRGTNACLRKSTIPRAE